MSSGQTSSSGMAGVVTSQAVVVGTLSASNGMSMSSSLRKIAVDSGISFIEEITLEKTVSYYSSYRKGINYLVWTSGGISRMSGTCDTSGIWVVCGVSSET